MVDFRHLGEREIYAGHILRLVHASFESPSGERFERDVVRSAGAVAVVPIVFEPGDVRRIPHVVLVSQFRAPHNSVLVEVPAGMRDVDGESDDENARRELAEEVGLAAGRLTFLTELLPSPGMTDASYTIFLATECTTVERTPRGPEEAHADVLQLPLREAVRWIDDGRIVDAKTVVALLMADRRLGEARSA